MSGLPPREVSGQYLQNAWKEWPEMLPAGIFWPLPELARFQPQSVDCPDFVAILTWWNWSSTRFDRKHVMNDPYSYYIFYYYWLHETGQIWACHLRGETLEGMTWNLTWCCILNTFKDLLDERLHKLQWHLYFISAFIYRWWYKTIIQIILWIYIYYSVLMSCSKSHSYFRF